MSMDLAAIRPTLVSMARQVVAELAGRNGGPTVRPGTVQGAGIALGEVLVLLDGEAASVAVQFLGTRPATGQRVMVLLTPPHGALVLGASARPDGPAAASYAGAGEATAAGGGYVDLATVGPSVTLITGGSVIVTVSANIAVGNFGAFGLMSMAVTGATTLAAADLNAVAAHGVIAGATQQAGFTSLLSGLTPGLNTFTAKYQCFGSGIATFFRRHLVVQPI